MSQQQLATVLQDVETGLQVDELGGHVLACDVLELDLAVELTGERAQRQHRVVEPLGREREASARPLRSSRELDSSTNPPLRRAIWVTPATPFEKEPSAITMPMRPSRMIFVRSPC